MATNYAHGHAAEESAANYLESLGYEIIILNWKTKWCEIDIVAQKDQAVYLVEVKYRENNNYGKGLDYITDKKLKQMSFAAEMWVSNHNWQGEYQLAAIEVSGDDLEITNFITDI